jgi:hypothetical protein
VSRVIARARAYGVRTSMVRRGRRFESVRGLPEKSCILALYVVCFANGASSSGTKRVQQVHGRQSKPSVFVAIGTARRRAIYGELAKALVAAT